MFDGGFAGTLTPFPAQSLAGKGKGSFDHRRRNAIQCGAGNCWEKFEGLHNDLSHEAGEAFRRYLPRFIAQRIP